MKYVSTICVCVPAYVHAAKNNAGEKCFFGHSCSSAHETCRLTSYYLMLRSRGVGWGEVHNVTLNEGLVKTKGTKVEKKCDNLWVVDVHLAICA